jgi:AraC-like DNA-binding protein
MTMTNGGYGDRIAATFRAESSSVLTTQLRGSTFAVTRVRRSTPIGDRTPPLPPEQAFTFGLQLIDRGNVELWTDNRLAHRGFMRAGTLSMIDHALRPSSRSDGKQDVVFYYVPRSVFDDVAYESGGGPITELVVPPGKSVVDPVVHHLSLALLPALEQPACVTPLFFEQVALAFQEHVLHAYGRNRRPLKAPGGGLARWQERRAKEIIAANLDGNIPVAKLAEECRLSRAHFVRAFKETTGLPPHRWLTQCRVSAAKKMMSESSMPLADIARACGFAHPSHFAKVFGDLVGTPPSTWRRQNRRSSI